MVMKCACPLLVCAFVLLISSAQCTWALHDEPQAEVASGEADSASLAQASASSASSSASGSAASPNQQPTVDDLVNQILSGGTSKLPFNSGGAPVALANKNQIISEGNDDETEELHREASQKRYSELTMKRSEEESRKVVDEARTKEESINNQKAQAEQQHKSTQNALQRQSEEGEKKGQQFMQAQSLQAQKEEDAAQREMELAREKVERERTLHVARLKAAELENSKAESVQQKKVDEEIAETVKQGRIRASEIRNKVNNEHKMFQKELNSKLDAAKGKLKNRLLKAQEARTKEHEALKAQLKKDIGE